MTRVLSPERIENVVRSQVRALLAASPAIHQLEEPSRRELERHMVRVGMYAADLARETWLRSRELDQRPMIREREVANLPVVRAQADEGLKTVAANQVARITRETLRAVAFPEFVADLVRGTFDAVTRSSMEQMESYIKLIENVSKTVDQFMQDNISDNQARDWLREAYPEHIEVRKTGEGARIAPKPGSEELPAPSFQRDLNLNDEIAMDEEVFEQVLVPAARRRLAERRLQMLSTLVLMGINRIVVTGGKIRATMGFHIDSTDRLHQEQATDFDLKHSGSGTFGYGPWSATASTSISYVRSTRADSDQELNVDTDLTGEVELHFKSDYFPLARFAPGAQIEAIRSNTPVPEENQPFSEPPAVGATEVRHQSQVSRRTPRRTPSLQPIDSAKPRKTEPTPEQKPAEKPTEKQPTDAIKAIKEKVEGAVA